MAYEGNLQDQGLADVLSQLAESERTGILTVQGNREIIAISFADGEVVAADALNESMEDGLGRVLADLELVPVEDFAGLAAEDQAGGGRVVDLLVERGYLTQQVLLEALRLHTYRLCRQALGWLKGEFKFYQGEEVSHEEGITPIPVDELCARAASDLGDANLERGRFPDKLSIYARVEESFDGALGERDGESPLDVVAGQGSQAESIYSAINGELSVAEIASTTSLPEFRVTYCLHRWEKAGLVRESERLSEPLPAEPPEALAPTIEPLIPMAAGPELLELPERPKPRRPSLWSRVMRRQRSFQELEPWPARVLGVALAAAFVLLFAVSPGQFAIPFPWQSSARQSLEARDRAASYLEVHRAANHFFLLHGRFPEGLDALVELGTLRPDDLLGEDGRPLVLSTTAVSYVVRSPAEKDVAESLLTETIHGNFLLDPDFGNVESSDRPPLVLLD